MDGKYGSSDKYHSSRKITRAVGRIVQGLQDNLFLGNLAARRDWGFDVDYVLEGDASKAQSRLG